MAAFCNCHIIYVLLLMMMILPLMLASLLLCPVYQIGFRAITEALGLAAVKAAIAIAAIIAGGRLVSFMTWTFIKIDLKCKSILYF